MLEEHHPVIQSEELISQHVTSSGSHDYYDEDDGNASDFYVIKARRKKPHRQRPPLVNNPDIPVQKQQSFEDYSEEQADDALNELGSAQSPSEYLETAPSQVRTIRYSSHSRRAPGRHHRQQHRHRHHNHNSKRKLKGAGGEGTFDDASEGDVFQYEDFDIDISHGDNQESDMSYEDLADYQEYRNSTPIAPSKERATPEHLIPKHRRIYSKWSRWTKCTPKCTTRRYK